MRKSHKATASLSSAVAELPLVAALHTFAKIRLRCHSLRVAYSLLPTIQRYRLVYEARGSRPADQRLPMTWIVDTMGLWVIEASSDCAWLYTQALTCHQSTKCTYGAKMDHRFTVV